MVVITCTEQHEAVAKVLWSVIPANVHGNGPCLLLRGRISRSNEVPKLDLPVDSVM